MNHTRSRNLRRFGARFAALLALLFVLGACNSAAANFQRRMGMTLPASVALKHVAGNAGKDPWFCWEISPAEATVKEKLIATWQLKPDASAFNGVIQDGKSYCRFEGVTEGYSGYGAGSYRAVGTDAARNVLVVFFYNG